MCCSVFVVTQFVFGGAASVVVVVLLIILVVATWYFLPIERAHERRIRETE
jgi:hypothetical protein